MKKNFFTSVVLSSLSAISALHSAYGQTEITKWQYDKKGAVSITYDDGSINQFRKAMPIMDRLNIPGTFFINTGQIKGSQYHGKFTGRPVNEIISETSTIPTNKENLFERFSAAGYLGLEGTTQYQTRAGAQIDDGNTAEACKIIDELYSKVRNGEFKPESAKSAGNGSSNGISWDDIRGYVKKGHEFASHMVTHPYMAGLDEANMLYELEKSREEILNQLGKKYTFSAEGPYGTENERVMEYAFKVYPALRNRMPESFLLELNRSSHENPGASQKEYVQWQRGATTKTSLQLMKSWIDTTASNKNIWLVLVIHGVDGIGWEALTSQSLDEYFTYLKNRDNLLWVTTFGDAAKYMRERMNSTVKSDAERNKINVTLSCSLEKSVYDLPLTLKTYVSPTWKKVQVKQGNETRILTPMSDSRGNFVLYQALPGAGLIEVSALPLLSQSPNNIRVLSYYSGRAAALDSFNVNQMTHIIYCFGRLDGNNFKVRSARDSATILKMVSLKSKNPELKVLLSLGGWGGCKTCSDVFATKKGRKDFVQSVKKYYEYFKVDGLDLDWEYPTVRGFPGHKYSPGDKKNFTKLVNELRKLGYQYELSFAAGASPNFLDSAVQWKKVMKKVDFVNLMTYDMSGPGSKISSHHTALYSTPEQPKSADFVVKYLINLGIPREKIIVGAAFYGKIFENADSTNNGLYQPAKFKRTLNYKFIPTQLPADSGWVYHWDEAACAPYLYNPATRQFFTYDDKRSVGLKTKYVIDNKLGGIMYWHLGEDFFKDGLLDEIDKVKNTYTPTVK